MDEIKRNFLDIMMIYVIIVSVAIVLLNKFIPYILKNYFQYSYKPIIKYLIISTTLAYSIFIINIDLITHAYSLFVILFIFILILLSYIDLQVSYLPDILTIPLLWTGVLFSLYFPVTSIIQSVYGAILGYGLLSGIAVIYRYYRQQEGIGGGDVKLFSALGAWLGASELSFILALATSMAIMVVLYHYFYQDKVSRFIVFGPYLAISGIVALMLRL